MTNNPLLLLVWLPFRTFASVRVNICRARAEMCGLFLFVTFTLLSKYFAFYFAELKSLLTFVSVNQPQPQ